MYKKMVYPAIASMKYSNHLSKKEVYYLKDEQKISFQLPDKFYFDKIKEVYFNKNGNINQANHIVLANNQKKIKIVFHLGSGEYEFQS